MCQPVVARALQNGIELSLDLPETANALSPRLVAALAEALEAAAAAAPPLVVLSSTGPAFCGGFDLAEALHGDDDARGRFEAIQRLLELVLAAPSVTVALVDGPAYGAGADLAAACDYRIATERARFRFPGSRFGIVLGLRRLTALLGPAAAADAALRARVIEADEALRIGLVTQLAPRDEWDALVTGLAGELASLDPVTRAAILRVARGLDDSSDGALLAQSSARPGLAQRIEAYGARRRVGT